MTAINLTDPTIRNHIHFDALPTALAKIGVSVPDALEDAIRLSAWPIIPDPSPEIDDAKRRLSEAATEADWLAAQHDIVDAATRGYFRAEVIETVTAIAAERRTTAFRESTGEIITDVAAVYNETAAEFTEAYLRLPQMALDSTATMRPDRLFDMTPDQAASLADAKRHADALSGVYSVYRTVVQLGNWTAPANTSEASRLGDFETFGQLDDAAHLIRVLAERGHADPMMITPLAPHACVLIAGGTLNLKHPKAAEDQRKALGAAL